MSNFFAYTFLENFISACQENRVLVLFGSVRPSGGICWQLTACRHLLAPIKWLLSFLTRKSFVINARFSGDQSHKGCIQRMIQTPVTCVLAIVGAFPWDSKTDGNLIVMHILGKYWAEQILGQNLLAFEVSPQVHCHRVSRLPHLGLCLCGVNST